MDVEFELFKERRFVKDGGDTGKWVTMYKNAMYTLFFVEDGDENYVHILKNKSTSITILTDGVIIAATGILDMAQLTEFMQDLAYAQATYEQIKQQFSVRRIN